MANGFVPGMAAPVMKAAEKREEKLAKQQEQEHDQEMKNLKSNQIAGSSPGSNFGSGLMDKKMSITGVSGGNIKLFFFLILVLHIFDMLTGFNRIGTNAIMWTMWYLLVALLAAPFLLSDESFVKTFLSPKIFIFVGVSVFAWFLPILITFLPMAIQTNVWFKFIVLISPPWLMYLMFSGVDDNWINKIRGAWIVIWIILLIATLIGVTASWNVPVEIQGQYEFNPLEVLKEVGDTIVTSIKKGFSKFAGVPLQVSSLFNKKFNDSVGKNFMGQVDPYTTGDLGVQFTKVRTFSSKFYSGQEVVAWADIQGESFKDALNLLLRCYAIDNRGHVYNGTIMTQGQKTNSITIKMREKVSASCTFDSLPRGYYDVWFAGSFAFETWAYVPYYFAPDELVKNAWAQNLDPAVEAGIDKRPVSIYTDGPVNLGLASEYDQPIAIDPHSENPERTLPPFGASVINQWADGFVLSIRHISLLVPDPFILKSCDRKDVNGDKGTVKDPLTPLTNRLEGYNEYTFGNFNGGNADFQSVTCFIGLKSNRAAEDLIGGYDLVLKTFAAKTNYVYTIRDSVRVQVQ